MHLASLKGHTECVRYLLNFAKTRYSDYKMLRIDHKDVNGETPLALSIDRKRYEVEWLIRKALSKNTVELILGKDAKIFHYYGLIVYKGMEQGHLWKMKWFVLQWVVLGFSQYELSFWAWRIVFVSNLIASITSFVFAYDIDMEDLVLLHYFNAFVQVIWWVSFFGATWTPPGRVKESINNNHYEKGLKFIGTLESEEENEYRLCHTCHVRKPLRSKHCKILNYCIHKFDHFCPFVGKIMRIFSNLFIFLREHRWSGQLQILLQPPFSACFLCSCMGSNRSIIRLSANCVMATLHFHVVCRGNAVCRWKSSLLSHWHDSL